MGKDYSVTLVVIAVSILYNYLSGKVTQRILVKTPKSKEIAPDHVFQVSKSYHRFKSFN